MKKILVCNQKMFLTRDEAIELKKEIDTLNLINENFIICPSYLNFEIFSDYNLGAQDAHFEDKGAFTGEISAYDLSLRKIKYCLIGHSDRRKYDDDKIINLKIKSVLRNSMTPIVCVGDTKLDKELRRTSEIIKKQLDIALQDVVLDNTQQIYIAYEPRYLLGGNKTLPPKEIIDMMNYIKKIIDFKGLTNYKLLYGGSITSNNIKEILSDDIDGYLIGNASVSFDELKNIINCIK